MITGLEHQITSTEEADVCLSVPSGKKRCASLRYIVWQVTCQIHDTQITCAQCQPYTLPAQIHILLRMGVMCVDTWHMVTKPLQSRGRKGENTGVSYGKSTSRLLAEVATLTLQNWQKGNKTVYLAWVRHISLDSVGRILIIVIPPLQWAFGRI